MPTIATDPVETTCEVYWIRRQGHTDMFYEGYVGITTKGVAKRFVEHRSASKASSTYPVHNAIRKYDDIVIETILIGTLNYCLDIERKLRPEQGIGWNLAIGGGNVLLGYKMSEESRRKISENNGSRNRIFSEEERLMRRQSALNREYTHSSSIKGVLREAAYLRMEADGGEQLAQAIQSAAKVNRFRPPWENPNADKAIWLLALDVFQIFCRGEIQYRAAKQFNIPDYKLLAMYKRFKEGWNPGLCPEWQKFNQENI